MKHRVMFMLFFLLCTTSAAAQTATGRSNTGTISLATPDAAETPRNKARLLGFEMDFSEPSGNKHLDAKETGRLRLVITNLGKTTVRGVVAKVVPLTPPTAVTYNDSISVGDIPVNASRYAIFYFVAGDAVPAQIVTFQVELFANRAEASEPKLLTFLTKSQRGE